MESNYKEAGQILPETHYLARENLFIAHIDSDIIDSYEFIKYPRRIGDSMFIICVKGYLSFTSGPDKLDLEPGMAYVCWKSSIYQMISHKNFEAYLLIYDQTFLNALTLDVMFTSKAMLFFIHNPVIKVPTEALAFCQSAFEATKREYERESVFKEKAASCLFSYFAYHWLDIVFSSVDPETPQNNTRQSRHFDSFMELLRENYKHNRDVEFYADKLFVTPKYLSQIVRDTTGFSARKYINLMVILEIKSLLKYTDMDIKEVAYSMNFANPSFFSKYFKNETGMTPSRYRMLP